jgi:nucleotide-binding universal stress UspA family protein
LLFANEVTFHVVEASDVESAIPDFATSNGIDILAMLHHRRGFFEGLFHHSRAKKMAYHTKMPLLAFH